MRCVLCVLLCVLASAIMCLCGLFVVYCVMLCGLFVVLAFCFVCGRVLCNKCVYVCVIRL